MKMEKDIGELKKFAQEFDDFFADFDYEMDYLANKASFESYLQDLHTIEYDLKKPTSFFFASHFKYPSFTYLP